MRFSNIKSIIENIVCLFVIVMIVIIYKSDSLDGGSISDASVNGIKSICTVADQAYDETESQILQSAEEDWQQFADLGYPEGYPRS